MSKNSIDRHLTEITKEATLLAMRSARKEIFFVVEGDADINLLSHLLGLPSANFVSCNGKETLMALYSRARTKGIDEGTIFFRDRDHDGISSEVNRGVLLLVTTRYDLEMELLDGRVFERLVAEFEKVPADKSQSAIIFEDICKCTAAIGAARLWSATGDSKFDFRDLKYTKIVNAGNLSIKIDDMVKYLSARSQVNLDNDSVSLIIFDLLESGNKVDFCCGEDFLNICHIGFSRYYKFCDSKQCSPETLWRMLRMSAHYDDVRCLKWFEAFRQAVEESPFVWTGRPLCIVSES